MPEFVCPTCGGYLQATRKAYYNVKPNTGELLEMRTLEESWAIYCENDHVLAPDVYGEPSADDLRKLLVKGPELRIPMAGE